MKVRQNLFEGQLCLRHVLQFDDHSIKHDVHTVVWVARLCHHFRIGVYTQSLYESFRTSRSTKQPYANSPDALLMNCPTLVT